MGYCPMEFPVVIVIDDAGVGRSFWVTVCVLRSRIAGFIPEAQSLSYQKKHHRFLASHHRVSSRLSY